MNNRQFRAYVGVYFLAWVVFISLALTGCTVAPLPIGPAPIAERIQLDERAAITAEASWHAAGTIAEAAIDVGLLSGVGAVKVEMLDMQAGRAIDVLRGAYDAGNAPDYLTASVAAIGAVGQLRDLVGADQSPPIAGASPFAFDARRMLAAAQLAPVVIATLAELRETIAALDDLPQVALQQRLADLREANDLARYRRIAKFAAAAGR